MREGREQWGNREGEREGDAQENKVGRRKIARLGKGIMGRLRVSIIKEKIEVRIFMVRGRGANWSEGSVRSKLSRTIGNLHKSLTQIQIQITQICINSMSFYTGNDSSSHPPPTKILPSPPCHHPPPSFPFSSRPSSFLALHPDGLLLLQLTFQTILTIIPPMKRTKQDHPSNPISLSNKRASLGEKYSTPQKNESNPPHPAQENNPNKSLYTHMKAELTNIKNDFERLIQREERNVGLTTKEKEMIELKNGWQTASKGKVFSAFKSDGPILFDRTPDIDTFDHLVRNKDSIDPNNKIFTLTKNINEAVNFKNKHVASKDRQASNNPIGKYIFLNPRENEVKQSGYVSLTTKKESSNPMENRDRELEMARMENLKLKIGIEQLEKECLGHKEEKGKLLGENAKICEENKNLKERNAQLSAQLVQNTDKMKAESEVITQYKDLADKHSQQLEKSQGQFKQLHEDILKERQQMANERNFYTEKLNELTFYNNNFYQDNIRITQENQILKDNITHLQKIIEDNKRINVQNEKEFNRKMDYLQKNLAEYEKREHMLEAEIEKLYAQLNNNPHQQNIDPQSDNIFEQEIARLKQQLTRQQEINELISKKYKDQLTKLNIEELTRTFQTSIQSLTNENTHLKNRNNAAESKIQELQEKIYCYQTEIALYQERERDGRASRSLSSSEWQELTEKIERLQTENKKLLQENDYKNLLMEVLQQRQGEQIVIEVKEEYQNLMNIVKDQLEEINSLQEQNSKLSENIRHFSEEIASLRSKKVQLEDQLKILSPSHSDSALTALLTKHQTLKTELDHKNLTIQHLKSFYLDLISRKQLLPLEEQEQKYYEGAVTALTNF